MQLSMATDYAIRALLQLCCHPGETISVPELGDTIAVSDHYLRAIIIKLKRAGLVGTVSGKTGGVFLTADPVEITMFDVICAVDGCGKLNRCLEEDRFCSQQIADRCTLRKSYSILQNLVDTYLKSVSIQDLAGGA